MDLATLQSLVAYFHDEEVAPERLQPRDSAMS